MKEGVWRAGAPPEGPREPLCLGLREHRLPPTSHSPACVVLGHCPQPGLERADTLDKAGLHGGGTLQEGWQDPWTLESGQEHMPTMLPPVHRRGEFRAEPTGKEQVLGTVRVEALTSWESSSRIQTGQLPLLHTPGHPAGSSLPQARPALLAWEPLRSQGGREKNAAAGGPQGLGRESLSAKAGRLAALAWEGFLG